MESFIKLEIYIIVMKKVITITINDKLIKIISKIKKEHNKDRINVSSLCERYLIKDLSYKYPEFFKDVRL